MPELPEVDAITGVVRKYAVGDVIRRVQVLRGPHYFSDSPGLHVTQWPVDSVYRIGKQVVMQSSWGGFEDNVSYVVTHNAMTGYFDWEHEPWTFDYVEGKRSSTPSDVRVLLTFESGRVLRFHDVRLFGRMDYSESLPSGVGPELMRTPNMMPGLRVITLRQFATLLESNWPVKSLLMQQSFVAGLGNIYANEGCHLAGLDPRTRACEVRPHLVPVLLEALRCVVSHSIPTVRYDWLNVYRRTRCGTCDRQVTRINLKGRATFICEGCQS